MNTSVYVFLEQLDKCQGPVVQSIVSLMSLLVVKKLTVLVNTIFNSPLFMLENCEWLL